MVLGIVERRLAQQQLTGPRAPSVAEAVRHSLAVQAQDPPLSRWSLGLRAGVDDAAVRAAISSGEVLRTHVLRPTWHCVHRDDLRWLLELTSPKVLSGMRARHRQLGITDEVLARAFDVFTDLLARRPMTRKELQPHLPTTGFPQQGQVVAHLLLVAELRGVICSGPLTDQAEHTYTLLDSVVAVTDPVGREEATDRLVRRFVAGHGPTSIRDLQRWCTVTKREALAVFAHRDFAHEVVDEVELWSLPHEERPAGGLGGVLLLPTFDEAFLSHDRPRFPRLPGHRLGELHLNAAEAGWGFVIIDGVDSGCFRRVKSTRKSGPPVEVRLHLADGADGEDSRLAVATQRMVDFWHA
ncbi:MULTISPECIES: winged helix DNA-binding domain-containing protein [unclassified Luteococcus]|uniref:winged helix DNA-binding domain-containing protein n=1 Tax=unclassified Luteococcus TaxID=2639923 RepID=UPI00313E2A1F